MDNNTTKSNVSSGEVPVKNVNNKTLKHDMIEAGYVFTVGAVEVAPLYDKDINKESSNPNSSGDTGNNAVKKSDYIDVGGTLIMKSREKWPDILQGPTLIMKGEQTKSLSRKAEERKAQEEPSRGESLEQ